ncbi:PspA/IM30 family protein [Dehalobacter sp. DCM]|uniref:PspA/IM30 family protein n=1 Tax=Dehalobacter sp. DCM TaxID=2907827 RepID=UPI0030814AEB|nr:PspA/IM30 family protein [Dehalobacter sp. DCM]
MSLFKRVSDNIRANLNSLLDKTEDPEKLLDQYLRDMEEDMADAECAAARQLAIARKFKAQLDDALALVEKRESQAVEALKRDREDLARKALEDKRIHQAKAADYRREYESSDSIAEQLKTQLREMKNEYEKLRFKRDNLAARAQSAKAKKEIYGVQSGLGRNDTRRNFERMEDKVFRMEAEAQAVSELAGINVSLDRELEALGNEQASIEIEMAALKNSILKEDPSF